MLRTQWRTDGRKAWKYIRISNSLLRKNKYIFWPPRSLMVGPLLKRKMHGADFQMKIDERFVINKMHYNCEHLCAVPSFNKSASLALCRVSIQCHCHPQSYHQSFRKKALPGERNILFWLKMCHTDRSSLGTCHLLPEVGGWVEIPGNFEFIHRCMYPWKEKRNKISADTSLLQWLISMV